MRKLARRGFNATNPRGYLYCKIRDGFSEESQFKQDSICSKVENLRTNEHSWVLGTAINSEDTSFDIVLIQPCTHFFRLQTTNIPNLATVGAVDPDSLVISWIISFSDEPKLIAIRCLFI